MTTDRWSAPARQRSISIGNLTITYLPDGFVQLHPEVWFSLSGDHDENYLGMPELISEDGYLTGSIGSLLVTGPNVTVLIDAGFGPRHLPAAQSHPSLGEMNGGAMARSNDLLTSLDAAVFTHLHDDHTGWLKADGAPGHLLRNTTLMASEKELQTNGLRSTPGWTPARSGAEILPGITAVATPGHTLGHMSYLIESQDESLLCFGDVMHSPVQVSHPQLNSCFEADPAASLQSRKRTIDLLSDTGMIGAGMHFGDVVFGRIKGAGEEKYWEPVG